MMIVDRIPDESPVRDNPNFLLQKAILFFDTAEYDQSRPLFEKLRDMQDWP